MNVMTVILSPMMAAVTNVYLSQLDLHVQLNLSPQFVLRFEEMVKIMASINAMMVILQMETAVLPPVQLRVAFAEIKNHEMISVEMDYRLVALIIVMMKMLYGVTDETTAELLKLDLCVLQLIQQPVLNNAMG